MSDTEMDFLRERRQAFEAELAELQSDLAQAKDDRIREIIREDIARTEYILGIIARFTGEWTA